ncbi:hypothetical protein [Mycobacterium sp. C31M]
MTQGVQVTSVQWELLRANAIGSLWGRPTVNSGQDPAQRHA